MEAARVWLGDHVCVCVSRVVIGGVFILLEKGVGDWEGGRRASVWFGARDAAGWMNHRKRVVDGSHRCVE